MRRRGVAVHHPWIDDRLDVRGEKPGRNIGCQIVPEHPTQRVSTVGIAFRPADPFAVVSSCFRPRPS